MAPELARDRDRMMSRDVQPHVPPPRNTNVVAGSLWMVGVSLLLFFLPVINGFVGGLIGGYKVGSIGRALTAAILPAVVVALGLWVLLGVLDLPVIGLVAGLAVGTWILLSDLGLFLGAALGGWAGEENR